MKTLIKRTAVASVLTIASAFALAACSDGSDMDGVYYNEGGQLTVKGTSVEFSSFDCSSFVRWDRWRF